LPEILAPRGSLADCAAGEALPEGNPGRRRVDGVNQGRPFPRRLARSLADQVILLHHETSIFIMMEMAVTTIVREKFSSQAAPEVLAALRQIAETQGRQF
jgi:hypothetical protein